MLFFPHQDDAAVPELVLCGNVAQKLDFSLVVSIKLPSMKTYVHKIPISAKKVNKLVSCMLAFFPFVTWY